MLLELLPLHSFDLIDLPELLLMEVERSIQQHRLLQNQLPFYLQLPPLLPLHLQWPLPLLKLPIPLLQYLHLHQLLWHRSFHQLQLI